MTTPKTRKKPTPQGEEPTAKVSRARKANPDDYAPVVGSYVWRHHPEHTEHAKNEKGQDIGGPLELPRWRKYKVVRGDATRIFLADLNIDAEREIYAVSRDRWREGCCPHGYARTYEDVLAEVWANEHRPSIQLALIYASPEQLARVADIMRYVQREHSFPRPEHLKKRK